MFLYIGVFNNSYSWGIKLILGERKIERYFTIKDINIKEKYINKNARRWYSKNIKKYKFEYLSNRYFVKIMNIESVYTIKITKEKT